MTPRSPLMLSVAEVAEQARVSPGTVYKEIREGRLRAAKIGRAYRVGWPALYEWLGTEGAVPQPALDRMRSFEEVDDAP